MGWAAGGLGLLLSLSALAADQPQTTLARATSRAVAGQSATPIHAPRQLAAAPAVPAAEPVTHAAADDLLLTETPDDIQLTAGEHDSTEPLERLRRRNAAKRWRELNESMQRNQKRQRLEQRFGAFPESEPSTPAAVPAPTAESAPPIRSTRQVPPAAIEPVPAAPPEAAAPNNGPPARLPHFSRGVPTRTANHQPTGTIPARTIQETSPVLTRPAPVPPQIAVDDPGSEPQPDLVPQPAAVEAVPAETADSLPRQQTESRQFLVPADDEPSNGAGRRLPDEVPLTPRPASIPPRQGYQDDERLLPPATSPQQLKRLSQIEPFSDYEPNPELRNTNPCYNFCPHPRIAKCPDCSRLGPDGQPLADCASCPEEVRLTSEPFLARNLPHYDYFWEASNLYHNPLYFEDVSLERYGHTRGFLLQPAFSVGKFAVQFVGLPYQATIDPIAKKRYALGYYRPGQWVPCKYYPIPWNTEAALVEAGVITGAYYLFTPW